MPSDNPTTDDEADAPTTELNCPECGADSSATIPVWEDPAEHSSDEPPDYLGCTKCGTMQELPLPDPDNTEGTDPSEYLRNQEWEPEEELDVKGRKITPFKQVLASARGCECPNGNNYPEWDGDNWVCEFCGRPYHNLPDYVTYIEYIRCLYCGEPTDNSSNMCYDCAKDLKSADNPCAAINRYDP